jgi:hypothetical protein
MFFACPTNNVDCNAIASDLAIGGSVTIPLAADNVVSWDIIYNGITVNIAGTEVSYLLTNLNGNVNTVTVAANGFGPTGDPCSDDVTCTLNFAAATCGSATQNPAGSVDVGTDVTLSLVTTGAVSATINGTPMAALSGTPGTDNSVTWTYTHNAITDETITATITNPNGVTTSTNCSWVIEVNCEDPLELSIPSPGHTGICFRGTPGCTYTIHADGPSGEFSFDVDVPDGTPDEDGRVLYCDNTIVVEADTTYRVGQLGQPAPAGGGIMSVPTLGEWALIGFVLILMTAGLFFMRRRRFV